VVRSFPSAFALGPGCDQGPPPRPFASRLADGLRRRAWHYGSRILQRQPVPGAEGALEWLARHLENDQRTHCGLVGAAIGTLARFGRRDDSQRLAEWLLGRQRNDGSFSDSAGPKHSLFTTACAIGGLLALDDPRQPAMKNDFGGAALRAAEFLMRQADDYGPTMSGHGSVGSLEHHFPEIAALACVPALAEAADWSHRSDFAAAAQRILHRLRPSLVPDFWSRALPQVTLAAEAALAVGRRDLATEVLRPVVATQRRSGDVPAWPGARWVSTAGLAHLTALWYRLGEHERADRSLAWLARRQNRSGSFYGSVGPGPRFGTWKRHDCKSTRRFSAARSRASWTRATAACGSWPPGFPAWRRQQWLPTWAVAWAAILSR
jgi:hypothetical protein